LGNFLKKKDYFLMFNEVSTKLKQLTHVVLGLILITTGLLPALKVNAANVALTVDGSVHHQTTSGFGAAINVHSWDNGKLKPALDMMVDQNGTQTFRVVMEMTDWEAANDDNDPNNYNWNYYNPIYSGATSFDTGQVGSNFADLWNTIDYLHLKGVPDSQIILSYMGIGPSWNGGTTVSTAAQENEWAEEVVSSAYYGYTHGHTFGVFSPNNEEDWGHNEGIIMSASVYGDAMNMVAQRLDALGMSSVRLLGPETSGINSPYSDAMASHPLLLSKVDHFDYHNYGGIVGTAPSIAAGYGKDFWISEFSVFDHTFDFLDLNTPGMMMWDAYDSVYNHAVLNNLGTNPGNDAGDAPSWIAYNAATKTYTPRKSFYQFGQVFKWVPIGSVRIGATSSLSGVRTEAFTHAGSKRLTILGYNTSSSSQTITVALNNVANIPQTLSYYQTNATSNMAQGADVAVAGGTATVTVPASTVFTLTGLGAPDSQAPSAPSNLAATGGAGNASLSWSGSTDNVGVSNYNVYRSTTAGFSPAPANKVGQTTSTTYADTSLSAGTYYYAVTAQDAAGNTSAASNEASAVVTSDTQAPSVNITAPASGATLSDTVALSAFAADNVAVAGVQFKLDGNNIGSELSTTPYTLSWDSSAAANGSHTLTAVARDAAGNSTTSAGVAVTVNNVGGALLLGSNTVQATPDSNASGSAEAFKYTAAASGAAGTLKFYVDGGSTAASLKVGVYSDNANKPGSLLTSGTVGSPAAGAWNTATLSPSATLTSGTAYWIGFLGTGGTLNYRDAASGSCSQSASGSGLSALPATWSSGQTWATCTLSAYVLAGSSSTGPKAGDINGDNSVNITDLSLLLSSYGQSTTQCLTNNAFKCDLSSPGDGAVNIFDLSILLSHYGS
jgi:fibronectin type 3 domain-containing protein